MNSQNVPEQDSKPAKAAVKDPLILCTRIAWSREAGRSHRHAHIPDTDSWENKLTFAPDPLKHFRRGHRVDASSLRTASLDAISNAMRPPSLQTKHVEDRRTPFASL